MVNLYQITGRPYRNITNPFVIKEKSRKSTLYALHNSGYGQTAREDKQGILINYVTRRALRGQHPGILKYDGYKKETG